MSSAPTSADISTDATWLAQALDPAAGVVRLIAMDRERYRTASFLDDRLLQSPVNSHIVPWLEVEAAMAGDFRSDARWIFHIGHVGSTLISRMLGEISGVLAIREPRLLRDLAMGPPEFRVRSIAAVPKLMSRTFAVEEIACVKATSFVSEIVPELVPADERALFMFATPRNYIASILAGENSVQEMRMLADSRAKRMAERLGTLAVRNDAELAAAAWACEMTALEAASEAMLNRHLAWADFDRMLEDLEGEIARIASFFEFSGDEAELRAIADGPLTKRYSKAPEYDYSPALRSELIAEVSATHGAQIDGALAMLHLAAEKSLLLARALERAGEA
jgi:hypothetical protein